MPEHRLSILIVDDNEDDALLIAREFRKCGYTVTAERVDTAEGMSAALRRCEWDVIITDVTMPHFSAAEALVVYGDHLCDGPFIVVSGTIGDETAVSLLKAGAHDFLSKANLARLVPAAERELRETEVRRARRRAEQALRASEERYALAARGSNDGLWDWDLLTNRIYYSPRWSEMLGLDEAEVTDRPETWFKRIHRDDAGTVRRSLDDHLAGDSSHFSVEYRILHSDGGWRWMMARGSAVFDGPGIPCRIAGSQTDITHHKTAEEQLRRAKEKLEHAIAAKTRFLAAASHDLRQPVQALLCFASLLEIQVQEASARATVSDMMGSLESLTDLLDALLDVSKLDAGVIKPDVSTFAISDVLERLGTEMGTLAENKGLSLRVVGSRLPVTSDPVLLGRVLRNLLSNAIRYTESGRILVGCRRRGERLLIEVHDTGIGISAEHQSHIFEEFFQIGNPERDRSKGLGLGLAIVSRLSQLLGHSVEVRSQPGKGSCFSVSVPLAARAQRKATLAAEPLFNRSAGSILVIDDERAVASALAGLLKAWGFRAATAASLEEALEVVHEPPRAIVADYRLREGRTGLEAVDHLRKVFAQRIPCIMVTGDTASDRLREIVRSGSLLLHKPVAPKELREALRSVLDGAAA